MVKNSMILPKKELAKFCLIGSGKVLTSFAKILLDNDFPPPILVTWEKSLHERDLKLLTGNDNYTNIFDFALEHNLDLIEANNANDQKVIEALKKNDVEIIFSISSRWILREPIISAFNGLVLNIHAGYLPRDRGSVVYSKILNRVTELGVTIHVITLEVDGGPILLKIKQNIDINNPTINEVTSINIDLSISLLNKFIKKIISNEQFILEMQDINSGIYMPQPYTEINGFIDWKWKSKHIESFIRAFGSPMPGAMTFYKNKEIKILEAYLEKTEIEFHPFYYGRVINITKEGYAKVATQDSLLVITKIKFNGAEMLPKDHLKEPNILYTPCDILEKARIENKNSLSMKAPSETSIHN